MSLSPDLIPSRPVYRVNGRVALRRPDHRVRSRTTCPFRFRFVWWSNTEPLKYFEELCENCKTFQNELGKFSKFNKILLLNIFNISYITIICLIIQVFFLCRNGSRYQYTALEPDSMGQERMELERKARQHAQNACQHYLRFCPRYALLQHLNDIGSR